MALLKFKQYIEESEKKKLQDEELKGNQHKLDKNKNGKVDAHDFKLLKKGK
jgi:hypothetical protein